MPPESRQISTWIDRSAADVYEYASDPGNLPEWAPGLGKSVENLDGHWVVTTESGPVGVAFVECNTFGVLDLEVTLPSGEVSYNPIRVVPRGDGSEIVFSPPDMSDADFARDAGARVGGPSPD